MAVAHLLWAYGAVSPGPIGGDRVTCVREAVDASASENGARLRSIGRYYSTQLLPALADLGLAVRLVCPGDYEGCRQSGLFLLVVRQAPNFAASHIVRRGGSRTTIAFNASSADWDALIGKACQVTLAPGSARWGIFQGLTTARGKALPPPRS